MSDVESKSSQPPDSDARALAAEFEPLPQIGPVQSARRYWWLVLLPVLVLVPVAVLVAGTRPATYTAESRLMVGRLNISTPGAVQGFAAAAQDLASTYPLVIYAEGVVNPVARQLGTTPAYVRGRLSATQVPSSSIVRVLATGPSAPSAIALTNAASNSLVTFLTNFNRDSPDAARLLTRLRAAELKYQAASSALAAVHAKPPFDPAAQKLAAAADAAKIQLNSISSDYQSVVQTQAISSLLQPLVYAHSASSNRKSRLELAFFIALVCGLLLGVALATLRANWTARSALTAPSWEPEEPARTG